eukprot:1641147-Amphidinium_carterae.1
MSILSAPYALTRNNTSRLPSLHQSQRANIVDICSVLRRKDMVVPKVTRCGHIFCLPCIMCAADGKSET